MKIGIIGAGSWGTALAQLLGRQGHNVLIWARRPDVVSSINCDHVNPRYFSDIELSRNVVATVAYEDCLANASAVAVVTPSNLLRGTARALARCTPSDIPVVICSKGIEAKSGFLATQIFEQEMGDADRFAVLSGPNHAEDVISGEYSASVIASTSSEVASFLQEVFAAPHFRTYASTDVVGVEVCAAAKNVMAIAVGLSYGLGMGDNTAALLMTRGLAEMSRLTNALGGEAITCMGLAGMGDLVVTCTSQHSRNRRFGEMIARGGTLKEFQDETHMVVEGALAAQTILPLAERVGVELPIAQVVHDVIWEGADPQEAGEALASRPLNREFYGLE